MKWGNEEWDRAACGCIPGSLLCPEAELLWAAVNGASAQHDRVICAHNWDKEAGDAEWAIYKQRLEEYRAHIRAANDDLRGKEK